MAISRGSFRPRRPVVALTLVAAVLAGCTGGAVPSARSTSTDVPFKGCGEVQCSGTIDGAAYQILLPKTWNGTLLLYSHGYRSAQPAPPAFAPVSTAAEPAPGWSEGVKQVGQALLAKGYALAGSGYASNGWAVADGVKADEDLYAYFAEKVAKPARTIIWGDSLGGLITEVLSEKHPSWVSGAVPLCGVLAGPNRNFDLALDVAYAVKTLIDPTLKLTGYSSYQEAVRGWQGAVKAVLAAGKDVRNGVPKILMVADLVDAPSQTRTYDGATVVSQVEAYAESALTSLGFGTFGRYEIERRFGGNPSQNVGVDYSSRISAAERSLIDTIGGTGTSARLLARLAAGHRVAADQAARTAFAASGTPTGDIRVPTLTLHTKADPLVLAQNETAFAHEVRANPSADADLVELFTVPPASYPAATGAPYGAGHCNFTLRSRVAVIDLMDRWVRQGVFPLTSMIKTAMGPRSGYDPTYAPGPWPGGP